MFLFYFRFKLLNLVFCRRFANGTYDQINAEALVSVRVPDSVTTFDFTAVAMNNIHGMGITDGPTSLKVFKNFFIQMTLPYNCKRTEVVILDINVFSYLDVNQTVTLSVRRNDIEFTVLEPSFDGWKSKNLLVLNVAD